MKNPTNLSKSEIITFLFLFVITVFSTYMLLKKVFFEGYSYGDPRIMLYSIPYTNVLASIPSFVYLIKNSTKGLTYEQVTPKAMGLFKILFLLGNALQVYFIYRFLYL